MSWMKALYDTYGNLEQAEERGLLKIGHSTQNAHIEVILGKNGVFQYAYFVSKDQAETIIPVTEESASRSSGVTPHPLFDKLKYLSGDYEKYCGEDNKKYHQEYMKRLKDWCESDYSDIRIKVIYQYLSENHLISDLIDSGMFSKDEKGLLTKKWENAEKIKLSPGDQKDAFIRFRVECDDENDALWQDESLQEKYIQYYFSNGGKTGFCYVTGENGRLCMTHPYKIRDSRDKAKLISSNDKKNFTYRGRFENAEQAYSISYEASQKAHNALKWLINNQGTKVGDKVFVLWGIYNENLPNVFEDTYSIIEDFPFDDDEIEDTARTVAERFNHAILGYHGEIRTDSHLVLLGLDAATTGRLSVIFVREYNGLEGNELIDSIESWHKTCCWNVFYINKEKERIYYEGAPSLINIAKAVYGTDQNGLLKGNDKVIANAVERILPCIIDGKTGTKNVGKKIPRDIVQAAVNRAKFPQNYSSRVLWYQVLSIACALYRKYLYDYEKEEYTMSVMETDELDYNCGRLLAVADAIEIWALREKAEDKKNIRTTTAMRYYTRFCQKPCDTWILINKNLVPYKNQLGGKASYLYNLLGEISSKIPNEEFKKKKNLGGLFCLGFDSQRTQIIKDIQAKKAEV